MLSVIIHFRNRANITLPCIQSVLETFKVLGQPQNVEFILVDDLSDPGSEVVPMLLEFRKATTSNVRIIHFTKHQHFARACAHSFSLAKGDILFISPDMILAPTCVQAMLQVAALDPSHGIVRATSNYVDCFPEHVVNPALPPRDIRDVRDFSNYVSLYHGLHFVEDNILTGDIMFIKRELIAKIGVMDPLYYGYFGDIDLGLRAQHAGFKLVCAKGAWLFHEGASFYKQESQSKKIDMSIVHQNRMRTVNDAYKLFREKWDRSLPPEYPGTPHIDFKRLRTLPALPFDLFQKSPPAITAEIGQLL